MNKEILERLAEFLPDYVVREIAQTHGIIWEETVGSGGNGSGGDENGGNGSGGDENGGNGNGGNGSGGNGSGGDESGGDESGGNGNGGGGSGGGGSGGDESGGNGNGGDLEKTGINDIFTILEKIENLKQLDVTNSQNNYIGFLEEKDFFGFVFPVSVNKLEQIKKLYEELKEYVSSKDEDKFFLLPDTSNKDIEKLKGQKNYTDIVILLTKRFLNSGGKQIEIEDKIFNNYKLGKIPTSFLKNPSFYRQFLTKEKIFVPTLKIKIDNKKTRFLKYYLQAVASKVSNQNIQNKLYWIVNVLLKDVKAEKTNVKVFQYIDLQAIVFYLLKILKSEIDLLKYTIDKINDLYEYWLYVQIVRYFNYNPYFYLENKFNKSNINIKNIKPLITGKQKLFNKLYKVIELGELEGKIETSEEKNVYVANYENQKKVIYFKDENDLKEVLGVNTDIVNNFIEEIKIVSKKNNLSIDIDKLEKEGVYYIWKISEIEEIKDKNIKTNLNKICNDYKVILENKKSIEQLIKNVGFSFIKEDLPDLKGLSTIKLDKLSSYIKFKIKNKEFKSKEKIDYYLSLGGHIKEDEDENHLLVSENLQKELYKNFTTLKELDLIKTDKITPDFILEIKQKDKKGEKQLIGKIFFDAKFSKYPFFENGKLNLEEIDYVPVIKYYQELGKYFSSTELGKHLPYKIIILFPGDKVAGKTLEKINNLFERITNVVAVPLMTGDNEDIVNNMKLLKRYIYEFTKEVIYKKNIKENRSNFYNK